VDSGESQAAEHRWMEAGMWRHVPETMRRLLRLVRIQRNVKELRVRETAALGERRFLALVEWKDEQLLIGVTPGAITLLKTQARDSRNAAKRGSEE